MKKLNSNVFVTSVARVFSATLAFLALSLLFSGGSGGVPDVFADDNISGSGSSEVNAVVKESISVGVDHNGLAFSITPTAVGAFASKSTNIHVYTNAKGYKLYISSKTAETSLKHIDSSVTKPIKTLDVLKGQIDPNTSLPVPAIDKDAFTVNSWGYSLDGTNFYGVSYDTPSLLKSTDNFTDIGDSVTPITFGASADTNMPAGTYQNTVVLTATATIVPPNKPTVPTDTGWVTSATISPQAAGGVHTVKTYEYYVTQDENFTPTAGTAANKGTGLELEISKPAGYTDGIYYVFSRAIDQADSRSEWSDQITVKLDATEPTSTLATSSDLKAAAQTATFSCSDNINVIGYYFGDKSASDLVDTDFIGVTPALTTGNLTASVTEAKNYTLVCKDIAGGLSEVKNQQYYTYNGVTLLDKIAGTAGNYITANYETTTTGSTFLAPANTEINPATLYTIPTPASKVENYRGASTVFDGSTPADLTKNNIALTGNTTFYTWFDRNVYTLTLQRDAGISNVTGDGTYKYGATANINAEILDGYNWSSWETISGDNPANASNLATTVLITQNTTLKAKNGDSQKPSVQNVSATSYNSFSFTITDNVGVTKYCVNNSATQPALTDSCWADANNQTSYTGNKTSINTANTWYVWGRDNRDNISPSGSIQSVSVTRSATNASLTTKWGSAGAEFSANTVALVGTKVHINASATNGYDSVEVQINGSAVTNDAEHEVTAAGMSISATGIDNVAPVMQDFGQTAYNTITLKATDAVGVTGFFVKKDNSTAPLASDAGWFTDGITNASGTYSRSYTFNDSTTGTYYVWAKDAAGKVSSSYKSIITRTVSVTILSNASLTVKYDSNSGATIWNGVTSAPTTIIVPDGTKLYAIAASTNSTVYNSVDAKFNNTAFTATGQQVTVSGGNRTFAVTATDTTAPSVTGITRTAYNTFTITASDNSGSVAGYYVATTTTGGPTTATVGNFTWVTNLSTPYTVPASDTGNLSTTAGTPKSYYVWVKDGSGNVSATPSTYGTNYTSTFLVTRSQGEHTALVTRANGTTDQNGACTGGTAFTANTAVLAGTPICTSASISDGSGYKVKSLTWTDPTHTGTSAIDLKTHALNNVTGATVITSEAGVSDLTGATYLQDVTSDMCTQTGELVEKVLTDRRDGKKYYVTRMKDGRCWMTQNLDLDLAVNNKDMGYKTSSQSFVSFSTTYSDITPNKATDISGSSWTLGTNDIGYATQSSSTTTTKWNYYGSNNGTNYSTGKANAYEVRSYDWGDNCRAYSTYNGTDTRSSCSATTTSANHGHEGNAYNWPAATAGTGTYDDSTQYASVEDSICPQGWKLPTGSTKATENTEATSGNEFNKLLYKLNSSIGWKNTGQYTSMNETIMSSITKSPAYFVRAGHYNYNGSLNDQGADGYYWSRSVYDQYSAYILYFYSGTVYPGTTNDYKGLGFSVRCLV